MKIDASRAIGAYAAVMTAVAAWALFIGAAPAPTRFDTLDVKRINIRENDGTLRMIIAGRDNIGGLIMGNVEYPHPNRKEAGLIFFNDEGVENGGLVFDGRLVDGHPTNSGHLSFDRWRQDQTLYLDTSEDGRRRRAGVFVQDRPDAPMDVANMDKLLAMPPGPARTQAMKAAGFDGSLHRAFLGRDFDDASKLVLRDGQGRERLRLSVSKAGAASIEFLDEDGRVTRSETALRP